MYDPDNAQFPHEITDAWMEKIKSSGLSDVAAENFLEIVGYSQPPVAAESITSSISLFETDTKGIDSTIRAEIVAYLNSDALPQALPRRLATKYPVFYAIVSQSFLGDAECLKSSIARQLIREIFIIEEVESISRHKFYTDLITTRHMVMAVVQSEIPPPSLPVDPKSFFISSLDSDILYQKRDSMREYYEKFSLLISGQRKPGERERHGHGGGRALGEKNRKKRRKDPWHDKQLTHLADADPPKRERVQHGKEIPPAERSSDTSLADQEMAKTGLKRTFDTAGPSGGDNDDSTEMVYFKRSTPSLLSVNDDKQMARRWSSSIGTSSLPATSDVHRLVPEVVKEIANIPLSPLSRVLATLILATGISVNRLRLTIVSTDRDDHDARQPIWEPRTGTLTYALQATGTTKGEKQWISLSLPETFTNLLTEQTSLTPGEYIFKGARRKLDSELRRHFKNFPGITPTASRLGASSWLLCRPHALDDCSAMTLTGDLTQSIAAPATYREIPMAELQEIFDAVLNHLDHLSSHPTKGINKTLTGHSNITDSDTIGSTKAAPAHVFVPIFKKIKQHITTQLRELSMHYGQTPPPTDILLALSRWLACHTQLAWHLSTGARPIGPSSQNRLGSHYQWIADKNSTLAQEFRTIPLLPEIRDDVRQYQTWTSRLLLQLEEAGFTLNDKREGRRDTPSWLERQGKRIVIRDMTWADLRTSLPDDLAPLANNCARHSLATHLRGRVSEPYIDYLLGHARDGKSLAEPHATTNLGKCSTLRKEIQTWLKSCGFKTIKWEILR